MDSETRPVHTPHHRLRILMVAARYFPFMGGIESHIHEVGRRIVARGHDVCVLTADPSGKLPKEEYTEGMRIIRVPTWLPKTDFCLAPGLATGITKEQWDIVHVQGYHTFSAPFAMLASIRAKFPFVLTFHSGGHSSGFRNRMRSWQYAILGPLARRATRLVGVSRFEADFFSRAMDIPRSRFTVVPNGASLPKATAQLSSDRDEGPFIVSLGRLERYKGHHKVIEAFSVLRRTFPKARLRVLGEGPYRSALVELVARLGLHDCTTVGAIPPAERHTMANLLASTDLVTLLSEYEAHPVAVMEALSLGVPVLTSDTSGFREMAEAGLVQSVSIDAKTDELADAMISRLRETRTAANVSLPSWDDCADQLISIYRSAARSGSNSPAATADEYVSNIHGLTE